MVRIARRCRTLTPQSTKERIIMRIPVFSPIRRMLHVGSANVFARARPAARGTVLRLLGSAGHPLDPVQRGDGPRMRCGAWQWLAKRRSRRKEIIDVRETEVDRESTLSVHAGAKASRAARRWNWILQKATEMRR